MPIAQRLLAALFCLLPLSADAGNGFWSSSGPDGGLAYDIVAHPTNPAVLYALARTGVFQSEDGGISWTRIASSPNVLVGSSSTIAIDAEQLSDLYVLTPGDALYRSSDGGANWVKTAWVQSDDWLLGRLHDVPGAVGALYTSIRAYNTALGSGSTVPLLKSTSFGESFAPFGAGLPVGPTAQGVAFQPGSSTVMLLGTGFYSVGAGNPNPASVFRSIDGGANWTGVLVEPTVAPNSGNAPSASGVTYSNATRAYAEISGRVRRSDDGGLTWAAVQTTPASHIAGGNQYPLLFAAPSDPLVVWVYGVAGLRKSSDGGVTFVDVTSGLSPNPSYTHPVPPTTAIPAMMMRMIATSDYTPGVSGQLWIAADGSGLFRSLDSGSTWNTSHIGLHAVNIRAIAAHPGQHVNNRPTPGSPALRLFSGIADTQRSSTGMFSSTNGGNSWNVLNSGLRAGQIRGITIDAATTGGVETNGQPSNPPAVTPPSPATTRMYAVGRSATLPNGYRNGGLYRSLNGGASWTVIDSGLPTRTYNVGTPTVPVNLVDLGTIRQLTLDPRSCSPAVFPCTTPLQRMWATASGYPSNLVVPANDPHCDDGQAYQYSYSHRLIRSTNGGDSWSASDNGIPAATMQDCTVGGTDYHITGTSITPLNVLVSPNTPNVLYAGTFTSFFDEPPGHTISDTPSGVFKSIDGGDTWTQASNGLPSRAGFTLMKRDVLALAIHPSNDQILWASVIDLLAPGTSAIYKTTNGGANWTASSSGIPTTFDIRALIVDPTAPSILYAAGAGSEANPGSVYKSEDGGATWRSISVSLPADSALSLALDPFNTTILHAGLVSGVYSMTQVPDDDGDGVPDATENNAPNGGDGNGDFEPDSEQDSVGSSVIVIRRDALGGGGFFTTDIQPTSTPSVPGGCQQAVDVQGVLAAQYGRDYVNGGPYYYKYPRDLIRFEVLDCARAIVDATFHNAAFATEYGWSFRYYGPTTPGDDSTFAWTNIGARVQRITGSNSKWHMTLDANQFGSYRPVSDRILFVGGPACYDDRLFRSSMETAPDSGPPSCDH